MDPPRAKPKLLNKALLSDIASTAAEHHMRSAGRANTVAGLYMLDKRFNRNVLRHLDKCDSAHLSGTVASLHGPKKKSRLELDPKLFTALVEHSGLVVPTVELECGFDELSRLKLTGVDSLKLVCPSWKWADRRQNLDHMVRIITENKSSLKALLDVPKALFSRLPWGLMLDEFSPGNVATGDVKIPALNTKVFKYIIANDTKIPLAFMRTVNAEEIHLQIDRLRTGSPMKPFGAKPANKRTKKLRVEFDDERVSSVDFGRIFREVAVFFPNLECFELVHEKRFYSRYNYWNLIYAVDNLVGGFERALEKAATAPYKVCLKVHFWYTDYYAEVMPEETDFKCGLLKTDLPPSEDVDPDKQHAYFVKEVTTDGRNLRVDCEVLEGTDSFDGSYSDDFPDTEDSGLLTAAEESEHDMPV